jgi:hypothetical protein
MLTTIIYIRYFKCFFTPCLGVLFGNILTSTSKELAASDLALTLWVQTIVSTCAEGRHELKSLEMFLQTLNHYAQLVLQQIWPSLRPQAQTRLDSQSSPPTDTGDPGARQAISSDTRLPGSVIASSLHKDEFEFLDSYAIDVAELSNAPYQTVLALEKSILTEPDPHRQWWTFES